MGRGATHGCGGHSRSLTPRIGHVRRHAPPCCTGLCVCALPYSFSPLGVKKSSRRLHGSVRQVRVRVRPSSRTTPPLPAHDGTATRCRASQVATYVVVDWSAVATSSLALRPAPRSDDPPCPCTAALHLQFCMQRRAPYAQLACKDTGHVMSDESRPILGSFSKP